MRKPWAGKQSGAGHVPEEDPGAMDRIVPGMWGAEGSNLTEPCKARQALSTYDLTCAFFFSILFVCVCVFSN